MECPTQEHKANTSINLVKGQFQGEVNTDILECSRDMKRMRHGYVAVILVWMYVPSRCGNRALGWPLHHYELIWVVQCSVVNQQVLNCPLFNLQQKPQLKSDCTYRWTIRVSDVWICCFNNKTNIRTLYCDYMINWHWTEVCSSHHLPVSKPEASLDYELVQLPVVSPPPRWMQMSLQ